MKTIILQNNLFTKQFIFVLFFLFSYQTSFAQNIETQYRVAVNKGDSNKAGKLAYQIGLRYHREGKKQVAMNYLAEGLKFSNKVKDYQNSGDIYSLLGIIYKLDKNYNFALRNYNLATQSYEFSKDKKKLAGAYFSVGVLYAETKQYDKAITIFRKTMGIANQANATDLVLQSTEYLSKVYKQTGDEGNAEFYKEFTEEIKNPAKEVITLEEKKDKVLKDSSTLSQIELEENKKVAENITQQQQKPKQKIYELLQSSDFKSDSLTVVHAKQIAEMNAKRKTEKEIVIYIGIGVGIIAILLIIFIIIQNKTVKEKQKANKELASANYELAAKNEEIEQQKEMIEKEKERSEALLLNILPREIAEELKHNIEVKPRSYDQVTVIFTDFKGFTQAAELLSPEELIDELAECFSEFDTICERWNLERIKTMGDAYMCAGGVPTPNYTNPVDAISAAMEMQEVIEQLKQKKILQGKPFFEMRLGIHTGAVVAGVVGKKRFAYDIWGDTVNLAARMESSGEVGRVNISEYTYSLVRDYFFCSYRGKIEAKNKGEVDMYFVVSKF